MDYNKRCWKQKGKEKPLMLSELSESCSHMGDCEPAASCTGVFSSKSSSQTPLNFLWPSKNLIWVTWIGNTYSKLRISCSVAYLTTNLLHHRASGFPKHQTPITSFSWCCNNQQSTADRSSPPSCPFRTVQQGISSTVAPEQQRGSFI